jgi:hypothetical protein
LAHLGDDGAGLSVVGDPFLVEAGRRTPGTPARISLKEDGRNSSCALATTCFRQRTFLQ